MSDIQDTKTPITATQLMLDNMYSNKLKVTVEDEDGNYHQFVLPRDAMRKIRVSYPVENNPNYPGHPMFVHPTVIVNEKLLTDALIDLTHRAMDQYAMDKWLKDLTTGNNMLIDELNGDIITLNRKPTV